jgi:hypothetical protein
MDDKPKEVHYANVREKTADVIITICLNELRSEKRTELIILKKRDNRKGNLYAR